MARKIRKNAGLIGLGIIGSRVAAALRAGGFRTFVWNRTPKPEPNFLGSPAEVAEVCEVVQLFVSDADALFEVIEAMAPALTAAHVVVCNATVGPEATVEAARLVGESGARFLDAPFTGSKTAADKRELTYYIGGDDETLALAEPVLRASAVKIVKIGAVGQAATMKIATNMLVGVTIQTLAEALAVVRKSGIDPVLLGDALETHAARSGLVDLKLPRLLAGDFDPQFSLKHMFKDVQLAIQIANTLGLDIPATTATAGVMYGALSRGWHDLDFSSVAKLYDEENEPAESGETTAAEAATLPAEEIAQEGPAASTPDKPPSLPETVAENKEPEPEPPQNISAAAAPEQPEAIEKITGGKAKEAEAETAEKIPASTSLESPTPKKEPSAEPAQTTVSSAATPTTPPASATAKENEAAEKPSAPPVAPAHESSTGPAATDEPPAPENDAPPVDEPAGAPANEEPPAKPSPVFNRVRRWFRQPGG